MNCVLLGYGTVGKSVETLCEALPALSLQHVFVRPEKADEPYFTNSGEEIVSDPKTDLVFECMNGLEPANTLIRTALKHGKHVVSSNKAVMSKYLPEYLQLAKEHGGSVQIEASVGGGIPILDAILKLSQAESLQGFEGILNGTSNYILSSMEKTGASFEDALQKAIDLGYAEADPTSDIEGIDVWYKALLASSLICQAPILDLPAPIGISKITSEDMVLAKENGRKIRHLAILKNEDGEHASLIVPVFVKDDDFFGAVNENYNAQLVYAPSFGSLGYYGQGAGGLATAQAMVANALDAANDRIRMISLDKESKHNPELIVLDFVVRTDLDPQAMAAFEATPLKDNYWLLKQKTPTQLEALLAQDPSAMIGVWK